MGGSASDLRHSRDEEHFQPEAGNEVLIKGVLAEVDSKSILLRKR